MIIEIFKRQKTACQHHQYTYRKNSATQNSQMADIQISWSTDYP